MVILGKDLILEEEMEVVKDFKEEDKIINNLVKDVEILVVVLVLVITEEEVMNPGLEIETEVANLIEKEGLLEEVGLLIEKEEVDLLEVEKEEAHLTAEKEEVHLTVEKEEAHLEVEKEEGLLEVEKEETHLEAEKEEVGLVVVKEEEGLAVEKEEEDLVVEKEEADLEVIENLEIEIDNLEKENLVRVAKIVEEEGDGEKAEVKKEILVEKEKKMKVKDLMLEKSFLKKEVEKT